MYKQLRELASEQTADLLETVKENARSALEISLQALTARGINKLYTSKGKILRYGFFLALLHQQSEFPGVGVIVRKVLSKVVRTTAKVMEI